MYKVLKDTAFALPVLNEAGEQTGYFGNVKFLEDGQVDDLKDVPKETLDHLIEQGFIEAV
jgi:hypothetical protein